MFYVGTKAARCLATKSQSCFLGKIVVRFSGYATGNATGCKMQVNVICSFKQYHLHLSQRLY